MDGNCLMENIYLAKTELEKIIVESKYESHPCKKIQNWHPVGRQKKTCCNLLQTPALVVEGGFLKDHQELKKIKKRIVSVFVVDKRLHKMCCSTKESGEITGVHGS